MHPLQPELTASSRSAVTQGSAPRCECRFGLIAGFLLAAGCVRGGFGPEGVDAKESQPRETAATDRWTADVADATAHDGAQETCCAMEDEYEKALPAAKHCAGPDECIWRAPASLLCG